MGAAIERMNIKEVFAPTVIIAIAGGGLVPARILRTFLTIGASESSIPILCVTLQRYGDVVKVIQWLDKLCKLQGQNVLMVDETDDSRKTLAIAVKMLGETVEEEKKDYEASKTADMPEWQSTRIGTFVVHNKRREKLGTIPSEIMNGNYFACEEIDNIKIGYPWDSLYLDELTAIEERKAAGTFDYDSGAFQAY
jgi:hypoxanthine phosphoribosyltransferase